MNLGAQDILHSLPALAVLATTMCLGQSEGRNGEGVRVMFREFVGGRWHSWEELRPQEGAGPGVYRHASALACRESVAHEEKAVRHLFVLSNEDASRDRLLTFAVILPVKLEGEITWWDDLYRRRVATTGESFTNVVPARGVTSNDGGLNTREFGGKGTGGYAQAVGTGWMSPYPFACVADRNAGYAIGIDIGTPVVCRLLYRPRDGLVAEFDVALSASSARHPNTASLAVLSWTVDPRWGFRSAAEHYYGIFPGYYVRRLQREGIWMPFTPVNEVDRWQDFGFAIHETHRDTRTIIDGASVRVAEADRRIGVASFQYTEPWDIQIPVSPAGLVYDSVDDVASRHPAYADQIARSVAFDEHGQWITRLISAPWFQPPWAISYTTSSAPDASSQSRYAGVRAEDIDPALAEGFDGIYFDSLEFFWHYDLNYRPEHIAASDYPLTFSASSASPRPALWNYQSQYAMLKAVCEELHAQGKLSMGNGYTWIPFAVSQLDILGTEFSWFMPAEEKRRVSAFRRTSCGQKPVVLLLNEGLYATDFSQPPYEGYRQYFEESLFYGFYPSFFSADASNDPYWKKPDAYNRGRPFFKKYIPLIVEINTQGWQPVTLATVSDPRVGIERFDKSGDDVVYFTLRNFSDAAIEGLTVEFDGRLAGSGRFASVVELVRQTPVKIGPQTATFDMLPLASVLLKCSPGGN